MNIEQERAKPEDNLIRNGGNGKIKSSTMSSKKIDNS